VGRVRVGDNQPVRLMGIINLSLESFYKGSVACSSEVLSIAEGMQAEGADMIDLGAVSTAPGSPPVSEARERERLFPALKKILDNLDITISIDTQRASIAEDALSSGAACINDVSGLSDPKMAACVAKCDGSLIIMASLQRAGDLLYMNQIIPRLGEKVRDAVQAGVSPENISVDPGIGKWMPEKTGIFDLALLDGFKRLRFLDGRWLQHCLANPLSESVWDNPIPNRGSREPWRPQPLQFIWEHTSSGRMTSLPAGRRWPWQRPLEVIRPRLMMRICMWRSWDILARARI